MQTRSALAVSATGWIVGLAALVVGAVLFGTLTPMPYHTLIPAVPLAEGYQFIRFEPTTFKDVIGNVLLYVPVGAVFWCVARFVLQRRTAAIPLAVFAAGFLSTGIEWAQVFIPGRFPSATDICMNCVGSLLGALAAVVFTGICRQILHSMAARSMREANPDVV